MRLVQGDGKDPWNDWTELFTEPPPDHLTKSRDAKGHSSWLRFRVHPQLDDTLGAIAADTTLAAYTSKADVARDALVRHIMYIAAATDDPDLRRKCRAVAIEERMRARQAAMDRDAAFVGEMEVHLATVADEPDLLKEAISDAVERMPTIRSSKLRDQLKFTIKKYR